MHIVRLTKTLPPMPGGIEAHALRLSEEQAKKHTVTVLYAKGSPPVSGKSLRFTKLSVRRWANRYFIDATTTALAALAKLRQIAQKEPIDLVHVHGDVIEVALLSLFTKPHRIPLVLTIHSAISPPFPRLAARAYRRADRLICVGSDIKKTLVTLGVPADRITVISSGIDYHKIADAIRSRTEIRRLREDLGITNWRHVLIFVGRLSAMKGVPYLLEALPMIQKRIPGAGLLLAGDGTDRAMLEEMAKGLVNVRFLGQLNQEQLVKVLHLSDLFVLPSITLDRTAEGVSSAAMQGMAAGLPIVSTDTGSMRDVVTPETGILVPERDPEAFAKACIALLKNQKLRRAMGLVNRRFAKEEKDWPIIASKVGQVYELAKKGIWRILVVTQSLDKDDDNQGAFYGWWEELAKQVGKLFVIGLKTGKHSLPGNTRVFSLGKERGVPKWTQVLRFYQILWQLRGQYNLIIAHQCPEYLIGATPMAPRTPKVLWYAFGGVSWRLWIAEKLASKILTSTPEGFRLPTAKRSIIGQGIDVSRFRFDPKKRLRQPIRLLFLGRISPLKDLETLIAAAVVLRQKGVKFTLTIAGRALTKEAQKYEEAMHTLAKNELGQAVTFMGSVPYTRVPDLLARHDLLINPSRTGSLDKTMLEAMAAGLLPLTSNEAVASLLPADLRPLLIFPAGDTMALVDRIKGIRQLPEDELRIIRQKLRQLVEDGHSVEHLIDGIMIELAKVERKP